MQFETEKQVKETILLVDDDALFLSTLKRSLGRKSFVVTTTENRAAANQAVQTQTFDYAVVDLMLGTESGLVVVEDLIQIQPTIKITLLTGYASIATAVAAIKKGAIQYLTKPASCEEIITALKGKSELPLATQPMSSKRLEWEHLQRVLHSNEGNISATARDLGMHRRTLQRKLQKRPVKS